MRRALGWAAGLALLAALAVGGVVAGGGMLAGGGTVSEEAAALIARGDAAAERRGEVQAEAAELAERISRMRLGGTSGTRGLGGGDAGGTAALSELEARLAALRRREALLADLARRLWEEAASIDAEAQDMILRRIRGSRPKS